MQSSLDKKELSIYSDNKKTNKQLQHMLLILAVLVLIQTACPFTTINDRKVIKPNLISFEGISHLLNDWLI